MNKSIFSINSLSKYSEHFQVVGVIGLIASLIFVGIELRQSQKIALASQQQARTETIVGQMEFLNRNGTSFHEWVKYGAIDSNKDIIKEHKHMSWSIYTNDFLQFKAGLMKENRFNTKLKGSISRNLNGVNKEECQISKEVWSLRKNNLDPDFVALIETLPNTCEELMN
jgi:hypothetical protein